MRKRAYAELCVKERAGGRGERTMSDAAKNAVRILGERWCERRAKNALESERERTAGQTLFSAGISPVESDSSADHVHFPRSHPCAFLASSSRYTCTGVATSIRTSSSQYRTRKPYTKALNVKIISMTVPT